MLRFSSERSRWAKGELWHDIQVETTEPDGSIVITMPVSRETEILEEILKHGSEVEVLKPEWLREKVQIEMVKALRAYNT